MIAEAYGVKAKLVPCLLALMALEILHQVIDAEWAALTAYVAMGLSMALAMRTFGFREYYLLTLCGVMLVLVLVMHPEPVITLGASLDQAVFLMAFLLCISLLQEAAQTSRSVGELGHYLAWQPGGRRYAGLYTGTMTMAVVFNIGTLQPFGSADHPWRPPGDRRSSRSNSRKAAVERGCSRIRLVSGLVAHGDIADRPLCVVA